MLSHPPPPADADGSGGKVRLLYLLAASHSGSTLLAMLLAGHPDLCTIGELKLAGIREPDRYRCSCGAFILECPFWQEIHRRMQARGIDFDLRAPGTDIRSVESPYARRLLRPLHRGLALEWCRDAALAMSPAWRRGLPLVHRKNAALAASVCAQSGSRVIVDSSKTGVRLKYLLRNPALDVRVVRLLRDGRAVALTYIDPEQFADATDATLKGGGTGASRQAERLHPEAAAVQWKRSVEDAAHAFARVPRDRRMELRYEELCADVHGTLRRLFTFAGVDPDRWQPRFRQRGHHVVGNGMRFDATSAVVLDERWRTAMLPDQQRVFDSVAGALNRRLGYV